MWSELGIIEHRKVMNLSCIVRTVNWINKMKLYKYIIQNMKLSLPLCPPKEDQAYRDTRFDLGMEVMSCSVLAALCLLLSGEGMTPLWTSYIDCMWLAKEVAHTFSWLSKSTKVRFPCSDVPHWAKLLVEILQKWCLSSAYLGLFYLYFLLSKLSTQYLHCTRYSESSIDSFESTGGCVYIMKLHIKCLLTHGS